jgi:catechol 2,3-dioxygenase-like lactoylglutathione lyase family enzyme
MISIAALAMLLVMLITLGSVHSDAAERLAGTGLNTSLPAPGDHRGEAPSDRRSVGSIGLTVEDMDRSLLFYTGVLSFTVENDIEVTGEAVERLQGVFGLRLRIVTLRLGDERIELMDYLAPESRPIPVDSRSNDLWFQHIAIITPDMNRAYAWLRRHNVRHASTGPQRLPDWNANAAGIRAFYFKDPDGHVLEVLEFPAGKGPRKWHDLTRAASAETLFLGIDHTAIVVDDTDASLDFYCDRLGFEVAGESENYGPEQERLNHVFGARLRITTLRLPGSPGPAVELLEYLAPKDGRPYPVDARASDLLHWQTTIELADVAAAWDAMRAPPAARLVSPGPVMMPDQQLGFRTAMIARDPDGHAIRLIER